MKRRVLCSVYGLQLQAPQWSLVDLGEFEVGRLACHTPGFLLEVGVWWFGLKLLWSGTGIGPDQGR